MSKTIYLMDTSFLLELNRIPYTMDSKRSGDVQEEIREVSLSGNIIIITVPVLLEYAGHISHIKKGGTRRGRAIELHNDIINSIENRAPWQISHNNTLTLKATDIIELCKRFAGNESFDYSLVDLSVIKMAEELQKEKNTVKILTFDNELSAYSSSHA